MFPIIITGVVFSIICFTAIFDVSTKENGTVGKRKRERQRIDEEREKSRRTQMWALERKRLGKLELERKRRGSEMKDTKLLSERRRDAEREFKKKEGEKRQKGEEKEQQTQEENNARRKSEKEKRDLERKMRELEEKEKQQTRTTEEQIGNKPPILKPRRCLAARCDSRQWTSSSRRWIEPTTSRAFSTFPSSGGLAPESPRSSTHSGS